MKNNELISTGVVRQIDELGRIVIPVEVRNNLGWNCKSKGVKGVSLEIYQQGDTVVFKKYNPGCHCCGKISNDLKEIKGIRLCKTCIAEFGKR